MGTTTTTTVADYELSVPARFVDLFRLSLVDEITTDAGWVRTQSKDLAKAYNAASLDPVLLDVRLADLSGANRILASDYELFKRISDNRPQQELAIRESYETLHGALQATIRRASHDIAAECDTDPLDGRWIAHRASAATWAAEEIERLNTEAGMAGMGGDA